MTSHSSLLGKGLLLLMVLLVVNRPQQEAERYPKKMSLEDLTAKELELIPGIGRVYSERLKNFQGQDWQEVHGLGVKKSALLNQVLKLP